MFSQCQVIGCKETANKESFKDTVEGCILGILYDLVQ